MGTFHNIIAVDRGLSEALGQLWAIAGPSRLLSAVQSIDPAGTGIGCFVREHRSRTYIVDVELVLASDPDLIAELAERLDCCVAGGFIQSTSGTGGFYAARCGEMIRRVSEFEPGEVSENEGRPLGCEAVTPILDMSGAGFDAAMREFGFEPEILEMPGDWQHFVAEADLADAQIRKKLGIERDGLRSTASATSRKGWLARLLGR